MKLFSNKKFYVKDLPLSDKVIFFFFLISLSLLFLFNINKINNIFVVEVPIRQGEINEGIVGVPLSRNPLYANTPVENDLASLLHAGLLKSDGFGGVKNNLSSAFDVRDGGEYIFKIRENAFFHNDIDITSDDVAHTIDMIKSLESGNRYKKIWEGVEYRKVNDKTIVIKVPKGNLNFPEGFSTPILPKHIWQKIPIESWKTYGGSGVHIGSGPYMYDFEEFTLDERPTEITLSEFPEYFLGRPYIKKIVVHFFPTSKDLLEAYERGAIDSIHSISPREVDALIATSDEKNSLFVTKTNRVFGAFFNSADGKLLQDPFVRSILSQQVERDVIIDEIFDGYADAIVHPVSSDTEIVKKEILAEELEQTFEDIGWKFDGAVGGREKDGALLDISLAFLDIEEIREIAEVIANRWRSIGVVVNTRALSSEKLSDVIASRDFDVILYGYEADEYEDLVDIWRSSDERNIASITSFGSPILNNLLEELENGEPSDERFINNDDDKWREMVYNDIKVEMARDVPAIFLYSPHFLYILPSRIMGSEFENENLIRVSNPNERFNSIHLWHIGREKVWRFLE